jgi:hypothetical protein
VSVRTASEIAAQLTASGLTVGTTVHGGDQALLVSGFGGSVTSRRVVSGLGSLTRVTLDVWARPLAPRLDVSATNVGNIFLVMEDSSNTGAGRVAAFRFGYYDADGATGSEPIQPHIDYATVNDGDVGGLWEPTGLLWDPNTWYNITMNVDFSAQRYDFFLNGAKVNTSPIPFYQGNTVNSFGAVRIFRGSYQAGMIVDDLTVAAIPEPAALALLLLGGGTLLLGRKR